MLTEQDKKNNSKETSAERELAAFLKESRCKSMLYNFITIAARSYIDGMQAVLRCQQAAQATL